MLEENFSWLGAKTLHSHFKVSSTTAYVFWIYLLNIPCPAPALVQTAGQSDFSWDDVLPEEMMMGRTKMLHLEERNAKHCSSTNKTRNTRVLTGKRVVSNSGIFLWKVKPNSSSYSVRMQLNTPKLDDPTSARRRGIWIKAALPYKASCL